MKLNKSSSLIYENIRKVFEAIESKNPRRAAHYYALMTCFFLSTEMLIIKEYIPNGDTFQKASMRSFFAIIFNIFFMDIFSISFYKEIKENSMKGLLSRGIMGWLVIICYYTTFVYISLSEGMVLILMSPLWTFFIGKILIKENFKFIDIILCLIGLFGVFLILNPRFYENNSSNSENENDDSFTKNHRKMMGIFFAIITSLIRTFSTLMIKSLSKNISSITINHFHYLFTYLLSILVSLFIGELYIYSFSEYFFLFVCGFVATCGQFLATKAISLESPGIIGSLGNFSVVVTFFYDFIILNSHLEILSIVGCICIIVSTVGILLIYKS